MNITRPAHDLFIFDVGAYSRSAIHKMAAFHKYNNISTVSMMLLA